MTYCNPITVDEEDADPLQDSDDNSITVDPCLLIVLYPEDDTEVPADIHSVPITVGVFVITGEKDEEGEDILVPVEAATLRLEATGAGGDLDDSTLETDEDGLAQTLLTTDTETGREYTVTAKLISFTYEGRERSLPEGGEPTLATGIIQVIPGSPAAGQVQVTRLDTPSDERSQVEVLVSDVKDQYGNIVWPVPISARLMGASGAVITENQGTVNSGMARLVLRSGSFPETLLLQTTCGTLDQSWFYETLVPFVDFAVTASTPASVPANSTMERAIQISAPAVADGTPMRLYSSRGVLRNNDTTIFNGSATITAVASGLPAGMSTIFGTVASKRVSMYGVNFEPDPDLDIVVEAKMLAGDLTEDETIYVEQLDGPEEPTTLTARRGASVAGASPGGAGYYLVRAGTKVTIFGVPDHQYELELRQPEQSPVLGFRQPPFFFHSFHSERSTASGCLNRLQVHDAAPGFCHV